MCDTTPSKTLTRRQTSHPTPRQCTENATHRKQVLFFDFVISSVQLSRLLRPCVMVRDRAAVLFRFFFNHQTNHFMFVLTCFFKSLNKCIVVFLATAEKV